MSNKNDLRPNSIAFSMDSYKTKDEFWKAVADQLRLLTEGVIRGYSESGSKKKE